MVEKDGSTKILFQEKFDPLKYIKTYYPDVTDLEQLLIIMYLLHTNAGGDYVVDVISKRASTDREFVENVAIFDFYREVVELLLPQFPYGNAKILDIGGGPTIYQHIAISVLSQHITHAEFLEVNRKEVIAWLNREERAHTWDAYFKLVQELFKYGNVPRTLQQQAYSPEEEVRERAVYVQSLLDQSNLDKFKHHVRSCLESRVVHGDIFQSDLGLANQTLVYDIVTGNFVVESVASHVNEWNVAMRNVLSKVKPGGYFMQTAIKKASWYQVGDERLPATRIDQRLINDKLAEEGFGVIYQKIVEGSDAAVIGYDGMIFTFAQRV